MSFRIKFSISSPPRRFFSRRSPKFRMILWGNVYGMIVCGTVVVIVAVDAIVFVLFVSRFHVKDEEFNSPVGIGEIETKKNRFKNRTPIHYADLIKKHKTTKNTKHNGLIITVLPTQATHPARYRSTIPLFQLAHLPHRCHMVLPVAPAHSRDLFLRKCTRRRAAPFQIFVG